MMTTAAIGTYRLERPAHQYRLGLADPPKPIASLTERYRPSTLAAMVGQAEATFRLETFLEAPHSAAFLFHGPTGIGKTTAALAVASALGAVEFGGLEVIKSGQQDAEAVERALDQLRFTPMLGSGWKVIIVDEGDYMSPKAAQVWLSALEDLPPRSVVIFTTNKVDKFTDRFLDRCERVEFASDVATHAQDAQALIAEVWKHEVGRGEAPRFATLAGVVDEGGRLSYRRVIRALGPLIAARVRPTKDECDMVTATSDPKSLPPDRDPCVDCGTTKGKKNTYGYSYERSLGRCHDCYIKYRRNKKSPTGKGRNS